MIPYNQEWVTGISLPVQNILEEDSIFPIQHYDWNAIEEKVKDYLGKILEEI